MITKTFKHRQTNSKSPLIVLYCVTQANRLRRMKGIVEDVTGVSSTHRSADDLDDG